MPKRGGIIRFQLADVCVDRKRVEIMYVYATNSLTECFITSISAESGFSDPLRLIIDDCVTAMCCRVDGNVAARCAEIKCVVIVLSKYLAGLLWKNKEWMRWNYGMNEFEVSLPDPVSIVMSLFSFVLALLLFSLSISVLALPLPVVLPLLENPLELVEMSPIVELILLLLLLLLLVWPTTLNSVTNKSSSCAYAIVCCANCKYLLREKRINHNFNSVKYYFNEIWKKDIEIRTWGKTNRYKRQLVIIILFHNILKNIKANEFHKIFMSFRFTIQNTYGRKFQVQIFGLPHFPWNLSLYVNQTH